MAVLIRKSEDTVRRDCGRHALGTREDEPVASWSTAATSSASAGSGPRAYPGRHPAESAEVLWARARPSLP
jgi:hypothetical protein